jgi:GNAT superfamily N-acetyltransferase
MSDLEVTLDPDLASDPGLRERLVDIWVDVSNAGGAVGFVPVVTRADVEPVAREAFGKAAGEWSHLVVASHDGDVIGFCFLERRPGPLFRHWLTVKRLQIHPSLQGRGLGGAFLDRVAGLARDQLGIEQIHLTVRGGTGTEAFYVRHGYELVARIPGVIRVAPGDDRDELCLVKKL